MSKRKKEKESPLGVGLEVFGTGLKTIFKAMREPRYGWVLSIVIGFFLGFVYGRFF